MDFDDRSPIVMDPKRRTHITEEPEPAGSHVDERFPDVEWIGRANQGQGHVPADYEWTTNPKQDQDDTEGG